MMTYPTEHSDAEFRHIELHLPTANRRGRPKIHAPREILNAVFYVLKSVWHHGGSYPASSRPGGASTTGFEPGAST